ncbi:ABC transporter permease [Nocardioides marmotae]|uniref:ABC transporter permease n=1 Tax=Nocardioides marmotae TaxID=2663857 RepID=A0A6I3JFQ6_9ACTN|nr:ABC transporter permease [Nocardioides marmotae]MCR6033292.1 ABC transporter permease [Gordonia jinghuaiqii]MBC9734044.1 ABC transporter permease [Nocardioides marmotae]MTB85147.1 ABC transporter permease [Nocardioides marmotae]MTB96949.1 ABC transporter permease [Nocardioides marmotae]QKE00669.1 ABC transporter permease [Nocardioides marmotae]
MSTTTGHPMTLDVAGTPKVPFTRLVGVELRKIYDTRAGRWLLGAIVLITAAIMTIFFFAADARDRTFENFISIAATPQGFLLPVLGILLVTSEWSQRTAMVTFALEPSRTKVVAAKSAAALVFGVLAFIAAIVAAAVCSLVGGAEDGFSDVQTQLFVLFFALQLLTLLQGLAYGLLLLNTPAAIVTFFVLPIASSIVFSLVSALEDLAPWLDLSTAQTPLFNGFTGASITGEEYAQLGTTTLIWIIIPFVLGWIRVLRAEVK